MQKSEAINELATALAKAQGAIDDAKKTNINPHFKNRYADLASVRAAIREPLAANGLSISQIASSNEQAAIVETVLMHTSGQWIAGVLALPVTKKDAQGYGSAISYARRYGLMAMLGMASDEDDDGNAATEKPSSVDPETFAKAADIAKTGKDNLTDWWKKLPKKDRDTFTTEQIAKLKAIAEEASGTAND